MTHSTQGHMYTDLYTAAWLRFHPQQVEYRAVLQQVEHLSQEIQKFCKEYEQECATLVLKEDKATVDDAQGGFLSRVFSNPTVTRREKDLQAIRQTYQDTLTQVVKVDDKWSQRLVRTVQGKGDQNITLNQLSDKLDQVVAQWDRQIRRFSLDINEDSNSVVWVPYSELTAEELFIMYPLLHMQKQTTPKRFAEIVGWAIDHYSEWVPYDEYNENHYLVYVVLSWDLLTTAQLVSFLNQPSQIDQSWFTYLEDVCQKSSRLQSWWKQRGEQLSKIHNILATQIPVVKKETDPLSTRFNEETLGKLNSYFGNDYRFELNSENGQIELYWPMFRSEYEVRTQGTTATTTKIPKRTQLPTQIDPALRNYYEPSAGFLERGFSLANVVILPEFISVDEHDFLVRQTRRKLKRYASQTYSEGHFDSVITKYRECSVTPWTPQGLGIQLPPNNSEELDPFTTPTPVHQSLSADDQNIAKIFQRVWQLFPSEVTWLPAHILDLHPQGAIRAHVDNTEFSGDFVAGLCLLSPTVMKFTHVKDPDCVLKVLLPQRCFYVQRHDLRYQFTHEIPSREDPTEENQFHGQIISRSRRISILFRDAKSQ
ncbi:hypothetical protein IWQ62_000095 [Dispira parvispora]|uniref:Alpha-ketoglutarate-dependent dioxygenase AlkB-like domain-containing protein n=1 Tax=Dispira parvispora TaxID=1520584 RepID=A0A9W8B0V6_9FUNG|nr:hypothetical protein IWQ62_000095 [Dispira parvispora]